MTDHYAKPPCNYNSTLIIILTITVLSYLFCMIGLNVAIFTLGTCTFYHCPL